MINLVFSSTPCSHSVIIVPKIYQNEKNKQVLLNSRAQIPMSNPIYICPKACRIYLPDNHCDEPHVPNQMEEYQYVHEWNRRNDQSNASTEMYTSYDVQSMLCEHWILIFGINIKKVTVSKGSSRLEPAGLVGIHRPYHDRPTVLDESYCLSVHFDHYLYCSCYMIICSFGATDTGAKRPIMQRCARVLWWALAWEMSVRQAMSTLSALSDSTFGIYRPHRSYVICHL